MRLFEENGRMCNRMCEELYEYLENLENLVFLPLTIEKRMNIIEMKKKSKALKKLIKLPKFISNKNTCTIRSFTRSVRNG